MDEYHNYCENESEYIYIYNLNTPDICTVSDYV